MRTISKEQLMKEEQLLNAKEWYKCNFKLVIESRFHTKDIVK